MFGDTSILWAKSMFKFLTSESIKYTVYLISVRNKFKHTLNKSFSKKRGHPDTNGYQ